MTDNPRSTSEESLIRIGRASSHGHDGVIDLTNNDSFLIETDGQLKKRSKLKRQKEQRPEVALTVAAHMEQAADRRYEVMEHRSTLDNQLLDQRHVLEESTERSSPLDTLQQSRVSVGTECNGTKPAPVKRKRIVESDGEAAKAVSSDRYSMQPNPMPTKKQVKKIETLGVEKKKNSKLTFQDKVLRTMFVACKPFNISNLLTLTQTTSESALEFALLSLIDKNLVVKKDFISPKGSTRTLYWANLEMANHKDAAQAIRIQYREDEMAAALREHKELAEQHQQIESVVESLLKEATNEELDEKIKQIELDICSRKERIQRAIDFKENVESKAVSSKTIKLRINKYREEWKRRKEKVKTFVENLSDAMEKKEKDVVKMLDIETDEMVGTKLPPKLN